MSQVYKDLSAGPVPPTVATSYVTDTGTAVPALNILNVLANDTTANNANGITTTASGSTVNVLITNRLQGTGTTAGATTADIITFPLGATAGTYAIEVRIAGAEGTTPGGVGYSVFGTVYTTGAAGSLQGTVDRIVNENAALTAAQATIVASANSAIVRVTGVAALNMTWGAVGLYTFIAT